MFSSLMSECVLVKFLVVSSCVIVVKIVSGDYVIIYWIILNSFDSSVLKMVIVGLVCFGVVVNVVLKMMLKMSIGREFFVVSVVMMFVGIRLMRNFV